MERVSEAAGVSLQYILQQRHRSELPTPPNKAEILGLPQMYQLTPTGGQFLLYDSGIEDHRRILIFAYDQGFELLSNSEHWSCDGTFKECQEIYYQTYTIHALVDGRDLPCLFPLLLNKYQTYQIFLREISNLVPGIP